MNIIRNKHYTINIDENTIGVIDNRLVVDWTFQKQSTRATNFQAKKLLRRKINSILRFYLETTRDRT